MHHARSGSLMQALEATSSPDDRAASIASTAPVDLRGCMEL